MKLMLKIIESFDKLDFIVIEANINEIFENNSDLKSILPKFNKN